VNVLQIADSLQVSVFVVIQVHRIPAGAVKSKYCPDGRRIKIVHGPVWRALVHRLALLRSGGISRIAGVEVPDKGVVHVAALLPHTNLPKTRRTQE